MMDISVVIIIKTQIAFGATAPQLVPSTNTSKAGIRTTIDSTKRPESPDLLAPCKHRQNGNAHPLSPGSWNGTTVIV